MTIDDAGRLREMFETLAAARPETQPSQFWLQLNKRNLDQLEKYGYENFKQTVAQNYFTWIMSLRRGLLRDAQIRFLLKNLLPMQVMSTAFKSLISQKHPYLSYQRSIYYNFLTCLLWKYLSQISQAPDRLSEPEEGNPPRVLVDGKLISQDLANSILEFESIMEGGIDPGRLQTIAELGAGYGRTAFVFLKLLPNIRYIIADIPPALYISERYLSNLFPEKRIFRFRSFASYADIEEDFQQVEIAFFFRTNWSISPKNQSTYSFISSLHEMRSEQIAYYLNVFDRLVNGFFFMKQWKESRNPYDGIIIREKDYPIPRHWIQVYWRECRVQTYFFEALFKLQ
jgi:putative sugar O-methyltransferase